MSDFNKLMGNSSSLFGVNTTDTICNLEHSKLVHYKNHEFPLYTGKRLDDMVESIKEHGIINPLIVRPIQESDSFEILAGHNRFEASIIAELLTVPCIIKRNLSEEEAYAIVLISNLAQRSFTDLTHSERALIITRYYELLKEQNKNKKFIEGVDDELKYIDYGADDGSPVANGRRMMDIAGAQYNLSKDTVARYLRIHHLIEQFKNKVDNGELSIRAGVSLSYLPDKKQHSIFQYIEKNQLKIDIPKAELLRKTFLTYFYNEELITEIFFSNKNTLQTKPTSSIKLNWKRYKRFFNNSQSQEEIEDEIEKALELYRTHNEE